MNCPYCHSTNVRVGNCTGQCEDCRKVFLIFDGHPYVMSQLPSPERMHSWRAPSV